MLKIEICIAVEFRNIYQESDLLIICPNKSTVKNSACNTDIFLPLLFIFKNFYFLFLLSKEVSPPIYGDKSVLQRNFFRTKKASLKTVSNTVSKRIKYVAIVANKISQFTHAPCFSPLCKFHPPKENQPSTQTPHQPSQRPQKRFHPYSSKKSNPLRAGHFSTRGVATPPPPPPLWRACLQMRMPFFPFHPIIP